MKDFEELRTSSELNGMILDILKDGPTDLHGLADALDRPVSIVAGQLRKLTKAGTIERRPNSTDYRLTSEVENYGLLDQQPNESDKKAAGSSAGGYPGGPAQSIPPGYKQCASCDNTFKAKGARKYCDTCQLARSKPAKRTKAKSAAPVDSGPSGDQIAKGARKAVDRAVSELESKPAQCNCLAILDERIDTISEQLGILLTTVEVLKELREELNGSRQG